MTEILVYVRFSSFLICFRELFLQILGSLMKTIDLSIFHAIGFAERDERGRDHGQAGPAHAAQPQLVHPGHLRHQRRRPLRGPRLAGQPAQEPRLVHFFLKHQQPENTFFLRIWGFVFEKWFYLCVFLVLREERRAFAVWVSRYSNIGYVPFIQLSFRPYIQ